jgi:hypothetical protein
MAVIAFLRVEAVVGASNRECRVETGSCMRNNHESRVSRLLNSSSKLL